MGKITNKYMHISFLVILVSAITIFATESGRLALENHRSKDQVHIDYGIGINGDISRGGGQFRLWFNDVMGYSLKGYKNWGEGSDGTGGAFNGELLIKPPFEIRFRPYLLVGYGYNTHDVDTTIKSELLDMTLSMGWLRVGLGGEARLGKNNNHGIALEVAYVNGSAKYSYSYTEIGGDQVIDTVDYTMNPLSISLLYTYYSCKKHADLDSDNDGVLDKEDHCPQKPEDFDGYLDYDGCPDFDNDGDGIADSVDEYPDSVIVTIDSVITPNDTIVIMGVSFVTSSAKIDENALPLLDSLAALLTENPDKKILMKEQINQDSTVSENDKLTNARVASVMNYLESKGVSNSQIDDMTIDMKGSNKEQRDRIRKEGLVIRNLKFSGSQIDSLSTHQIDSIVALSKEWTETDITLKDSKENRLTTARVQAVLDYLVAAGVDASQINQIVEQVALGKEVDKTLKGLVLKDISWETNSSTLKASSYKELDAIVNMLKVWPYVELEVQGHTDNIGSNETNLKLSQKRAQAVADYFINKGISPDRLTIKGYGESQPKADNNTEEGRSINRRVELKQFVDDKTEIKE